MYITLHEKTSMFFPTRFKQKRLIQVLCSYVALQSTQHAMELRASSFSKTLVHTYETHSLLVSISSGPGLEESVEALATSLRTLCGN